MQKDEKNYTFLFTRQSRSRIYIHRIEVSKKLLHNGAVAAFLVTIFSAGIFGFIKLDISTPAYAHVQTSTISQQVNLSQQNTSEVKTYDYSRPAQANLAIDRVGGPDEEPYQLTNEPEAKENDMEAQLASIEKTSSPEFIPSMWAHLGKVNNEYGYRRNPFGGGSYEFHSGMDIDGERGDAVIAPAKGTVVKAGWQGGYGNLIEVDHGRGIATRYGHLSQVLVHAGDRITRGQLIARMGSTGRSTGSHLHYEVRIDGRPVNPIPFMKSTDYLVAMQKNAGTHSMDQVALGGPSGGK